MLYDGCIEDSNGYYNETYKIILGHDEDNDRVLNDNLHPQSPQQG